MISQVKHGVTYQQCQKHWHSLDTAVTVVGLDEDSDRVASKEMRERKADGPADHIRQRGIYKEAEFPDVEDVLVQDQD